MDMDIRQILEMISINREFLKLKSNIAFQNLPMLHQSFDRVSDPRCTLSLSLNDSVVSMIFDSDYQRAIDISQRALDKGAKAQDPFLTASHELVIGRSYTMLGRYSTARGHLHRAEALASAIIHPTDEVMGLRADILHDTAMNHHFSGGDAEQTVAYLDKALSILDHTTYRTRRGVCLMGIGNVRFGEAKYEEALTYYERALDMLDDIDSYANVSAVLSNMGSCLIQLSRYEESEKYLMRSLDLRSRMGSYAEIAMSYYNLFVLYWERGERIKGYDTLLISRDYAQISRSRGIMMRVLEALEKEARERGDNAGADTYLAERIELQAVAS